MFYQSGVEICRGDVKRKADLERVVAGADYVVNLAHGGGGANFEAIRAAMVDSAATVAEVCRAHNIKRLVHVGSISGLYLGDAGDVITGSTPTDPRPDTRNDYSHAKALADAEMLKAHQQGLPVVVLRPGLVVGAGTSPFHGGLGFFNNDQYCVGWNGGNNALPWVLGDDCADAIVAALTAPNAPGKAYNLVGDVRPTARQYLQDLSKVLQRPLHFVPSSPTGLWLTEMGKWAVKKVAGQKVKRPLPPRHPVARPDGRFRLLRRQTRPGLEARVRGWGVPPPRAGRACRRLRPRGPGADGARGPARVFHFQAGRAAGPLCAIG